MLGVVEEVFEFEIVISLANNLSGCVHITDINPVFTSLLEQEEEDDGNDEVKYFCCLYTLYHIIIYHAFWHALLPHFCYAPQQVVVPLRPIHSFIYTIFQPKHMTSRLQKYFSVGTLLKCVVVSTDSSKHGHSKVRLSINPEDVNSSLTPNSIHSNMVISGYVTSTEDHGYAMSLGVKGIQGFLPKKNVTGRFSIHYIN